jgi:hypothetical protein
MRLRSLTVTFKGKTVTQIAGENGNTRTLAVLGKA